MYDEDQLLPISALQHWIYCPRQCALIHLEQQWAENRLTAEGRNMHAKAHDASRGETRPGVRITRGLPLRSFQFGLVGQADVVEFLADDAGNTTQVVPVEYKRGRPKKHDADRVQLCAQALCLEEMLGVSIPVGKLFYGQTRRRQDISFDNPLRDRTRSVALELHAMMAQARTPSAVYEKSKCDRCSLIDLCMSDTSSQMSFASATFQSLLYHALGER